MKTLRYLRLIPILTLFLLRGALAQQPAAKPAEQEDQRIGGHGTDYFFDSDGVKIHYTVMGQGEPVLLIHGYTVNIAFQWVAPGIMRALAAKYQVIAIDNRGHGSSDKPYDPAEYGAKMAEDQIRLLDHLKIEKAHIVGYSMGGFITMKLLATHPERFLSATLGGSGWMRETEKQKEFSETLAASLEEGRGLGPLLGRVTSNAGAPVDEERVKSFNAVVMAMNDPKALAACIRGMKGLWVTEEEIRRNTVPALALIGEFDDLKETVDPLAGMMPHLEIVVIENTNHMTSYGKPKFIATLLDFLGKHGRKA
ncbi:alpha/beta hydrolase [Candidatus Sumerlaeota bacterium]|nr:alpha/beta hydrolase [Candidatus Sumerlaeota bacterium]